MGGWKKNNQKQYYKKDKKLLNPDEKIEQWDMPRYIVWATITFLSVDIGWFDVILREQFFTRLLPGDMAAIEIGV